MTTGTTENLRLGPGVSDALFRGPPGTRLLRETPATVTALRSIRVRLTQAACALDHVLAALSNPLKGERKADVVETVAEAFDRELLYLAAAFDILGRRYPLLIDPTRDPKNHRQSLDGKGYVRTT